MISSHFPLLLAAFAGLSLNSCVATRTVTGKLAHKAYRMDTSTDNETAAFEKTTETIDVHGGQPTRLGYLEFDDQGELWRMKNQDGQPTQLNTVLKDMHKHARTKAFKVIVFIHGWNNSASPRNGTDRSGNLHNFKDMLAKLSHSCDTPIYGVYVAWRGTTWPWPTFVDVWDRDATAGRVGGPTMLTALRAVSTTAHEINTHSSVIMVGHSFGGKILTQVTAQHLSDEIGRSLGEAKPGVKPPPITPLADTVVVINTAANGREMRQVKELMRAHQITYQRKKDGLNVPLFVTVASESDVLVHRALPLFLRLNRDVLAYPDRGGNTATPQEDRSLYHSMGHNQHFLNFEFSAPSGVVSKIPWPDDAPIHEAVVKNLKNGREATHSGFNLWLQTSKNPASGRQFSLEPKPKPDGYQSPCWGFRVPDFAVSEHSGLWQPNFVGIISALNGMTRGETLDAPPSAAPTLQPQKPL